LPETTTLENIKEILTAFKAWDTAGAVALFAINRRKKFRQLKKQIPATRQEGPLAFFRNRAKKRSFTRKRGA